ncbi:MAG: LysR family transcriptional regulator [Gordonia paraffinivorans]
MELRQLEYFLAVYEERSFTAAAGRVNVVQSAVSASVAALERELGAALFDRSTRRVVPTEVGVEFAARARTVQQAVESAVDGVAAVTAGLRGTVRVGLMHALLSTPVASAIAEFRRAHPEVMLRPRTDPDGAAGLLRGVRDGDLDVAVAAYDPGITHPGVSVRELCREEIVLVCPTGHRLATRRRVRLSEVTGDPFVDVPSTWGSRAATDRLFHLQGLTRQVDLEVNDVATVVDLVRAGCGMALIAPSSAGSLDGVAVVRMSPAPVFTVGLVLPADRGPRRAALRLAELVLETVDGPTTR